MSIDWSCAPAEATHYCIGDDLNPWRKIVGTTVYAFNRKKWVMWSSFNEGYMPAYYAPIPLEAWDGQGLPPVGTVCEYRHMIWPEYRPCEIRYISEESLVAYDDAQEQFYRTCDMLFRPIRTPEQIAAEEREKAVGDMAMSIQGVPYQYPTL
ncbi:TPA: hypothetical protein ACQT1Q_006751, partial [Pseudomonas aeruginosa]